MKESIQYVLVWNGWLRLSHWTIAAGVLFQIASAFALIHQNLDYDFWFDWHQIIGQVVILALGLRAVLLFQPGSSHWSSIIPKKSKLTGIGQMLKFYISMGKAPLPNWYAHNPLWQPIYLIILPVLLGVCITGMMQDRFAQLHASLAAIISLFTLFHVITAFVHDWKGKGAMISAMINGYRYFHKESPVQNSVDRGSEINISVDNIGRIKSNDE